MARSALHVYIMEKKDPWFLGGIGNMHALVFFSFLCF